MIVAALMFSFLGFAIWVGMSDTSSSKTEKRVPVVVHEELPGYSIISDSHMGEIKRSVDVRLEGRVSEATLSKIAQKIKSSDSKSYERTFIVYYLPDGEVGTGGWATSHFNPKLEVKILGSETQITPKVDENEESDVVGRWGHSTFLGGVAYTIIRSGDDFLLRTTYKDGSTSEESVQARREGKQVIIKSKDPNASGDYWIMDDEKGLLIMDSEGLIVTAKKLTP